VGAEDQVHPTTWGIRCRWIPGASQIGHALRRRDTHLVWAVNTFGYWFPGTGSSRFQSGMGRSIPAFVGRIFPFQVVLRCRVGIHAAEMVGHRLIRNRIWHWIGSFREDCQVELSLVALAAQGPERNFRCLQADHHALGQ